MSMTQTEIELKFLVPRGARAAVVEEMARKSASLERRTLAALYLDTPDRRLAKARIAWRLRREGRRWIQTLKGAGTSAIERFEHEVLRPGPSHDAAVHAGTPVGEKLARVLDAARADGLEVGVRFRTEVRRVARRVRTRGALVEVAFDEGRLLADDASLPVRELEFELISGSAAAMLGLAERWRKRLGLVYDPRSKAERGDRLAEGFAFPPIRKARPVEYPRDAGAAAALGFVLEECIAHISHNAIGLVDGDGSQRVEHVHQVRVGTRRLRSALRSFKDWTLLPPPALVDQLRRLFSELGRARDSDVLDRGVAADLADAGAPPLQLDPVDAAPDPAALLRDPAMQQTLLGWITFRVALAGHEGTGFGGMESTTPAGTPATAPSATKKGALQPAAAVAVGDGAAAFANGTGGAAAPPAQDAAEAEPVTIEAPVHRHGDDVKAFHHAVERRLRRWHRRIVADSKRFSLLDEDALHSLRKRIKRQRYAVEFFAPVLRRKSVERYLEPLMRVQERMGELNDLFVARARYQSLVESEPAAWFALGWLAARIAQVRVLARRELKQLARTDLPAT